MAGGVAVAPVMSHRDSRARAEEALRLRAKRKTYQEIADMLGFQTRAGARLAVERLLGRRASATNFVAVERGTTAESLRSQEEALQPLFDAAVERDDQDAAVILSRELRSLANDRARLTGIAAPTRTEVDVRVHMTPAQIIADARQRLLAIEDGRVIDAEVMELP